MKRRFTKILGVGLTLALLCSLLLTAAPVSALSAPSVVPTSTTISATTSYAITFNLGKELSPPFTLITAGDGNATWSTTKSNSGTASVLLDAGTGLEASAGRIRLTVAAIPMADFTGVTFSVWADAWTNYSEGTWTVEDGIATYTAWPYGTPYINILIDKDGDGAWDDKLEGIGSVDAGSSPNAPPLTDQWVNMEEVFYYDQDDSMAASSGYGPPLYELGNQASDLATWKAWFAANYPTYTVVGVEITFGYWGIDVTQDVYVDDVMINSTPFDFDDAAHNAITIVFPPTTVVPDETITGATLVASPGWIGGVWKNSTTDNVTFVGVADTRTVTATLGVLDVIGEGATVRIGVPGITNPAAVGSYTLTVKTSKETAVTSAAYEIKAPTVPGLPGVVSYYNSAGVLMGSFTGANAIQNAVTACPALGRIDVDTGLYTESNITTAAAGVVIKATGTAAETTVKGNFVINHASITIDGFTITPVGVNTAIGADGNKATFQNCVFTKRGTATTTVIETLLSYGNTVASGTGTVTNCTFDTTLGTVADTAAILVSKLGLTISNNTFVVDGAVGVEDSAINVTNAAGTTTITGNTFSGASGIGVTVSGAGTTKVTSNTFSNLNSAFNITDGTVTISSNTIDVCGVVASATFLTGQAAIVVNSTAGLISITNNDITNSPNDIIEVVTGADSSLVNMMFNNLTDNTLGVDNDATEKLNATHNWWGVATGPAAGINVPLTTTTGLIDATAYLGSEATGTFALESASLITKTTVGVDVTATPAADAAKPAIIGVANYATNPQDATPLPALDGGFYDVYLADEVAGSTASVLIKFYNANVTANTVIYIWGTIAGGWQACTAADQGVNLYSGYAYVTIKDPAMLTGTPFALVAGTVAAIDAPTLSSPVLGDDTVRLRPVFAWLAVPGAAGYYFELADNAEFVVPMVKMEGDMGRLSGTTYAYVGAELPYSKPYHWRVKAVSGTIAAGNLAESAWTGGVFITMDEPVEPTPPVVVEPTPPAPPAPIIEPIVEVIVPPAPAAITPAWIYAIIAVGGVLVISLIVLIVRTRRVA